MKCDLGERNVGGEDKTIRILVRVETLLHLGSLAVLRRKNLPQRVV